MSLVEFALILPLFALMLFGMIDFGLVVGGFISLRNQVNAAGRDVAISQSPAACAGNANPVLCIATHTIRTTELGAAGTVEVAVDFPDWNPATGETVPTAGQPVVICARATLHSTTGMTSAILNGRAMQATTETVLEVDPSAPANNDWDASDTRGFSRP